MAAAVAQIVVTIDGEEKVVEPRPVDLVRAERKFGSIDAHPFEATCFMAWSFLARTAGEKRAFDAWLNEVEAVDMVEDVSEDPGPFAEKS